MKNEIEDLAFGLALLNFIPYYLTIELYKRVFYGDKDKKLMPIENILVYIAWTTVLIAIFFKSLVSVSVGVSKGIYEILKLISVWFYGIAKSFASWLFTRK